MKKEEYIEWLKDKGEEFPESAFKQELNDTINLEMEVSNILLRTYVEMFAYSKCGDLEIFVDQHLSQINSHKMKYQRNFPPLPVLDINRDLRNHSIHSDNEYKFIKSSKTPNHILRESIVRITNKLGEKEIGLFHNLNEGARKAELNAAHSRMSSANSHSSFMTFGELLIDEVLECIRQIDLI